MTLSWALREASYLVAPPPDVTLKLPRVYIMRGGVPLPLKRPKPDASFGDWYYLWLDDAADWVWNDVPDWIAEKVEAAYDAVVEFFSDPAQSTSDLFHYVAGAIEDVAGAPDVLAAAVAAAAACAGTGGALCGPALEGLGQYIMVRAATDLTADELRESLSPEGLAEVDERGYVAMGGAWHWGRQVAARAAMIAQGVNPDTGQPWQARPPPVLPNLPPADGRVPTRRQILAAAEARLDERPKRRVWPWVAGAVLLAGGAVVWWRRGVRR